MSCRNACWTSCVFCFPSGILHEFVEAFGVFVCRRCKGEEGERYELLPKSRAKELYHLTDKCDAVLPLLACQSLLVLRHLSRAALFVPLLRTPF